MNNRKNMLWLVCCVMVLIGTSAEAADVVTADNIDSYIMSVAGNNIYTHTTMSGFTVDGAPHDDVWAVIVSEIDGEYVLNGYGETGPGGVAFRFTMFGSSANPFVSASHVFMIINDDDPTLFLVNMGTLMLGIGDDEVFGQEHLSINGGEFGDISDIFFSYHDRSRDLDSVVLSTTVPEPTSMSLLAAAGVAVLRRRRALS